MVIDVGTKDEDVLSGGSLTTTERWKSIIPYILQILYPMNDQLSITGDS